MRTLVISDIHGNIDALTSIGDSYDNIICLGDIVDYGPRPAECVQFLQGRQVIRTRGNHDHAVAYCKDCRTPKGPFRHLSVTSRTFTLATLSDADKQWLGEAETAATAANNGLDIFAVHGAPSDHLYKYLTSHTPDKDLAQEVDLVEADMIFTGHTHQPFIKELNGKLLVNVGSVGQPRDGIAKACYAVIEDGKVEIKRSEYDIEAAVAKTRDMPLDAAVIDNLVYLLENAQAPPRPA
jgi:putative phosphoesterase